MSSVEPTLLAGLPLFSTCADGVRDHIAAAGKPDRYAKGKVLFLNGDAADHFFLIKKGWIKLFRETLDGDQAIIDILPANTLFGETAIFENDTYAYSAEVVEDSEIIRFPLKVLKNEIEQDNRLALAMLKAMNRYRYQQEMEIEHRTLQSAPQRIGCFLLRLVDQNAKGPVTLHLPYDKTLLASRLGMQPETFSRALARLKEEVGLEIKGSSITGLSVGKLAAYACSACSSSFPCADK